MHSLQDKLVLITGASSGIGRASAIAFSDEGMRIALVDKNVKGLEATFQDINRKGKSIAKIFPFDLRKTKKIPALIKDIELAFGGTVDILINAAGVVTLGYVEDVPLEEYCNIFEINFFAALALIQAIVPAMKEKKSGQIINITSGVGVRGLPGVSSYCATKFALNGLTESIRVELKPFGIKVISFSPGPTNTSLYKSQKIFSDLKENFIAEKMSEPEDVASKILKASKSGARYIETSYKSKIARHLNYWSPSLFDSILEKKNEKRYGKFVCTISSCGHPRIL